ncbi:MAG: 50S ribosomal protein L11 methyltransferase [Woeseiaceae bacterium]
MRRFRRVAPIFITWRSGLGFDGSKWRQFIMDLGSLNAHRVEQIFSRHGAQAVMLSDAGNDAVLEPAPGETPLWPESRITGLFSDGADLDSLQAELLDVFDLGSLPAHNIEELSDRPWEREWLKDFRPMSFGDRLWVSPGAFEVDAADAVVVRLDPGLAFGTGAHPTTALCLRWLDGLDIGGKTVLDYGCGSGILGIAALLLGARSASALDNDVQAITATGENATRNGVANRLFVTQDVVELRGAFDIVVAHILAEPLVQHAREISDRVVPGGSLALSGILVEQAEEVMGAYRDRIDFGVATIDQMTDQSWVRLVGKRI